MSDSAQPTEEIDLLFARARELHDHLEYGLWITDRHGDLIYVSDAFLSLVGLTFDEARDRGWVSVLSSEDVDQTLRDWEETHTAGDDWSYEHRFRAPDGSYRTVLSRGRPVHDDAGEIVGYVGMNVDITERKRAEERVRQEIRDREEVTRIIAHDLRVPLNTIKMSVSLLREEWLSEEQRTRKVDLIDQAADRMDRLIGDLRSMTLIEAGRLKLSREPLDAAELIEAGRDTGAAQAEEGGVDLVTELPPRAPPVLGDRARVLEVFANLLSNALRHTPEGGRVTLSARVEEAAVRFEVADTGPGIPEENLSEVFQRFWRGSAGTRGGSGIGLTISQGIVEAHGGRIGVESPPGGGARFHFTLPRADAAAEADEDA